MINILRRNSFVTVKTYVIIMQSLLLVRVSFVLTRSISRFPSRDVFSIENWFKADMNSPFCFFTDSNENL